MVWKRSRWFMIHLEDSIDKKAVAQFNSWCLQCNFILGPNDLNWRYAIFGFRIEHISHSSIETKINIYVLHCLFSLPKAHCQRNWIISYALLIVREPIYSLIFHGCVKWHNINSVLILFLRCTSANLLLFH